MHQPESFVEIFLYPGDFYFGDENTRIRTTLGSCVSITMWHPKLLIGGMCHYQLPSRKMEVGMQLDGHYADEAMQLFLREIKAADTRPAEYRVKLFGGGDMFPMLSSMAAVDYEKNSPCLGRSCSDKIVKSPRSVSAQNVLAAYSLMDRHGFKVDSQDMGGQGYRQLFFDIWSGDVWLRKQAAKS